MGARKAAAGEKANAQKRKKTPKPSAEAHDVLVDASGPLARRVLAGWSDPSGFADLVGAISSAAKEGAKRDVDEAVTALVVWGARTHAANPELLWTTHMRSPLRVALHLVSRAALEASEHSALFDVLWAHAGASAASRRALAYDANVPPAILARVASDADPETRMRLAENDALPTDGVAMLATDAEGYIRGRAVRRPNADADTLARAAKDEDPYVRDGAAGNPSSGPKTLEALASDPSCLQSLAGNAATPPALLAKLAAVPQRDDNDYWRFAAIAKNANTPASTLDKFATTWAKNFHVAGGLLENRSLPAALLALLVPLTHKSLHVRVAAHPNASDALLAELAKSKDPATRTAAVGARKLSPEELTTLSRSKDVAVRAGVAQNEGTPLHVLDELANDPDASVRRELVLPSRVNSIVANDYGPEARRLRQESCRATPELLARLASDKATLVRRFVADCPKTSTEVLARLASDKDPGIRSVVAGNQATPPAALAALLKDDSDEVRALALTNPATPWNEVVARIRTSGAPVLRAVEAGKGDAETIAARVSTPPRALALLANKALDEVAENPRTLLEDLAGTAKAKKPASSANADAKPRRPTAASKPAKVAGPAPVVEQGGRVPCLRVRAKKGGKPAPVDRIGGLPSPWGDEPWPMCEQCLRPMTFAVQLIGKAAGGRIDLGSWAALQVFVCDGDPCPSYEPLSGMNAAILRSAPLVAGVVAAPKPQHGALADRYVIDLKLSSDDARLRDDTWADRDEKAYEQAFDEAIGEKVGGVMVYGNEPRAVKCPECQMPLAFLAHFYCVKEIIGGSVYLHLCPKGHAASYQSVR